MSETQWHHSDAIVTLVKSSGYGYARRGEGTEAKAGLIFYLSETQWHHSDAIVTLVKSSGYE